MAKYIKRRKKRIVRFNALCVIFFSLSLVAWILSSLLINTRNNELTIKIQKMNYEIESLKLDNQNIAIEIQTLQNKDRIYVVAQESGLNQNQDNVISVKED